MFDTQYLSGAGVEPVLYLLDFFVRYLVKVRSFWKWGGEVLGHQTVSVLVQPAFSRMIRSYKVEFRVEFFLYMNVVCKFLVIVCGERENRHLVGIQLHD